ncbi:unnamed protein product [Moneuplotes crassus]|uniref:Uncharacterized protein n=1 Tax=Euplotes crassus TaxID=5936 RepID=A0AAD1Y7T4_EUPCR|nr:unnamed protein product [Moneuplotes crassus]
MDNPSTSKYNSLQEDSQEQSLPSLNSLNKGLNKEQQELHAQSSDAGTFLGSAITPSGEFKPEDPKETIKRMYEFALKNADDPNCAGLFANLVKSIPQNMSSKSQINTANYSSEGQCKIAIQKDNRPSSPKCDSSFNTARESAQLLESKQEMLLDESQQIRHNLKTKNSFHNLPDFLKDKTKSQLAQRRSIDLHCNGQNFSQTYSQRGLVKEISVENSLQTKPFLEIQKLACSVPPQVQGIPSIPMHPTPTALSYANPSPSKSPINPTGVKEYSSLLSIFPQRPPKAPLPATAQEEETKHKRACTFPDSFGSSENENKNTDFGFTAKSENQDFCDDFCGRIGSEKERFREGDGAEREGMECRGLEETNRLIREVLRLVEGTQKRCERSDVGVQVDLCRVKCGVPSEDPEILSKDKPSKLKVGKNNTKFLVTPPIKNNGKACSLMKNGVGLERNL